MAAKINSVYGRDLQRIYINIDELASYYPSFAAGLEEVEEEKLRLAIYTSASK